MTDNQNPQANNEADESQAGIALQRIYLKDVSFESPNAPAVFRKNWEPELQMDLHTKNQRLDESNFEVVVSITVTCTIGEMTAYIVEVQQAGIFTVQGLSGTQLAHVINAYCPNILFPYLRETIDSIVIKGSFPAPMLAPVNFDVIFAQAVMRKQQEAAAQQGEQAPAAGGDGSAH